MCNACDADEAIVLALEVEQTSTFETTEETLASLQTAMDVLSRDDVMATLSMIQESELVDVADPLDWSDKSIDEATHEAHARATLFDVAKVHPLVFGVAALYAVYENALIEQAQQDAQLLAEVMFGDVEVNVIYL